MQEEQQEELFAASEAGDPAHRPDIDKPRQPLAVRMRPRNLQEVLGQSHLLDKDALLPRLISGNQFGSLLFYGPPGSGKTTLAEVIARETKCHFIRLNAVLSNVAELRDVLRLARSRPVGTTLLFIDEIHRFNKAQQDLLLPDVESGALRLIGATTHNPGFYLIPALLSRSHLFRLEPLESSQIVELLNRALTDVERGLGGTRCTLASGIPEALAKFSDGDMRRALNALETLVLSYPMASHIPLEAVESFARERRIRYDANEDEHYDTSSALIKSIRGGDPDAAMYWLTKMLLGGEDPVFIARRLVILASEDIGLADSRALLVATAAFQACQWVGQPECELNLAHATLFLATCPKSNSATVALSRAKAAHRDNPTQAVPLWLKDSHSKIGKSLGHGEGYLYSHDFPHAISGQEYLEKPLHLYTPIASGAEGAISERLAQWKQCKKQQRMRHKKNVPPKK